MNIPPLRLVALEVTRTCTLLCRHCRGVSQNKRYENELSLNEITSLLTNIATFSNPIIIITGGEPLTRADIFDITRRSTSLGLRTVLATCGHFLTEESVRRLRDSGVARISVSLDGATAETHDSFRGVKGAFHAALKGLENARNAGLEFQINSTFTAFNIGELERLHNLAVTLGAEAFHPFLLVPMGRGSNLAGQELSPEDYELALICIARTAADSPIQIKPTCCPHYYRVLRQLGIVRKDLNGASNVTPHLHSLTKGCIGGQGFVFISHTGKVQMCGFLEIEAGDIRECAYDMKGIWETSAFFNSIRDIDSYHGKCGICEYRQVCGGCRARAYCKTGDCLGPEPNCLYIPSQ